MEASELADVVLLERVILYGIVLDVVCSEAGIVYSISALRDVGNSLRKTRLSWRWCGRREDLDPELLLSSGSRSIVHASPFLKRRLEVPPAKACEREFADDDGRFDSSEAEIPCPDSITSGSLVSSQRVSHLQARKSGLSTIPRRMPRLVLTPEILVSSRTLRALLTTESQLVAVIMIFATMLSKSGPMTTGDSGEMFVSTRMPLPPGTWNSLILPILNAKFADGSSAHSLSCME